MFKVEKKRAFNMSTVRDIVEVFDQIDLSPPYQRYSYIWKKEKRQLLIDSIINDYDIPKIYLHYITESNSEINPSGKPYAIIDGKQRLLAIHEFMKSDLPLSDDFVYEKNLDVQLAGLTYSEIAKKYSEIKFDIDNFDLDIVYIITDDIEKIEEFFYRLNEGQPLNNAEKRNRIVGRINTEIKRLIGSNSFFTNKFVTTSKRLQYEDICLKLIYIEFNNSLVSFDKEKLDDFVESNRSPSVNLDNVISQVENNLNIISAVFSDNDPLLKSRSLIPVYYFFITRDVSKFDVVHAFLQKMEEIRITNRKQTNPNSVLLEFDRQNQQGVHRQVSLEFRYKVLSKFYTKYLELNGDISWNTRVIIDAFNDDLTYELL